MAKGPGGNINTANSITSQQLSGASDASARSAADYSQFKSLVQPLVAQQTDLASGNRQEALAAAMPIISKLSGGFQGSKTGIMNNLPAGAGRDRALADLTTQTYAGIGGAQAGMVQQAPKTLADISSLFSGLSTQELGALFAGLQGGAQTNQGAGQMAAQQQKSLLDFFGGLAGSAAGMFAPIKL